MKAILSLRKHHYLQRVGILLIAVALIAGVAGCEGAPKYDLTMAVAPPGSGTATDETGTSPYERATVVDIKAVPNPCYRFVSWTAQAGQFGNSSAPETTFTMPAEDVTVTAHFEPVPADHYKFYLAEWGEDPPATFPADVQLKDQFGTFNATVGEAVSFGNPVKKVDGDTTTPISDRDRHYTFYYLEHEEGWEPQSWKVTVNNQFQDDVELTVRGPNFLAVPTQKEDHEMSDCLDHLLVYEILLSEEPMPIGEVDLYDQFRNELGVKVYEPVLFANPVQKTVGSEVSEIQTDEHYVFYPIDSESFEKSGVPITNQFGAQTLDIGNPVLLAVPSEKISWEQPLNHFKSYSAWGVSIPQEVQLEDQFVTINNATVGDVVLFCNPVEKTYKDVVTPIWDPKDHLTLYELKYDEELVSFWQVTVNNQFGNGQWLGIGGPVFLAVPTGKLTPNWPADLNHFLVYLVIDYDNEPEEVVVELKDQFTWDYYEPPLEYEYNVKTPLLFAVPAQKTVPGSAPTQIIGDEHLLFYFIDGDYYNVDELLIANQFGLQYINLDSEADDLLAVPSVKILAEPWEPIL